MRKFGKGSQIVASERTWSPDKSCCFGQFLFVTNASHNLQNQPFAYYNFKSRIYGKLISFKPDKNKRVRNRWNPCRFYALCFDLALSKKCTAMYHTLIRVHVNVSCTCQQIMQRSQLTVHVKPMSQLTYLAVKIWAALRV